MPRGHFNHKGRPGLIGGSLPKGQATLTGIYQALKGYHKYFNTFDSLQFDKLTHSYILNGKPLRPASGLISQLEKPVNWEDVAKKKAAKEGGDYKVLLRQWKEKGIKAAENGTLVHEYIEYMLSDKKGPIPLSLGQPATPEMKAFDEFMATYPTLNPVKVEWRVGDYHLGVGGTIDTLMYSDRTKLYHIFDWKTGENFSIDNKWQTLLPPFNDLEHCKWNVYSFQLSVYK
ncbi:hypothetical protein C4577_01670, partial [Candidatus Parcubacteria bacterium]